MILVQLTKLLNQKGVKSKELADYIGIAEANLSILRTGKLKSLKMTTLHKICEFLNCQPGDLLVYVPDDVVDQLEVEIRRRIREEEQDDGEE